MKILVRRNILIVVALSVVALLSTIVAASTVENSFEQYINSLQSSDSNIPSVNSVKPHAIPGTVREALILAQERSRDSSLPIIDITDRAHRDGIVKSKTIGTAIALTTDGWIMLPDSVITQYGKNAKVLIDANVYDIDDVVGDKGTSYSFAKTEVLSARVGTFGSSISVSTGDLVFVVTDNAVYPRTVANHVYYKNEGSYMSSDVLSRKFLLDSSVESLIGAQVTNSVGEIIGVMDSENTVVPFHHVTSVLESVLVGGKVERPSIGVDVQDVSRVIDIEDDYRKGWRVVGIKKGSPVIEAGLKVGDVILMINRTSSVTPLSEYIATAKAGDIIQMIVDRGETEIEIFVTLE
jgi:S1-C subfamily serine protease